MKFGIIEIGSTNTKAYIYNDGKLTDFGLKHIEFKNNYNINNSLQKGDIDLLINFINDIKAQVDDIYAFGTSIFRKISSQEKDVFTNILNKLDVKFKVVSANEESEYTVKGVIEKIDYCGKMAVVIGGGGSTEIAIINNKKIIKKINLDFGAIDITNKFPELKNNIVKAGFDEMLKYATDLIGNFNDNADVLVLAGGDYIYFYQKAGYKMNENTIYQDDNQPYLLDFDTMNGYDVDILSKSLDDIKEQNSDNSGWWDGARGMRFCMNAVARELKTKYIIPTKINMLIGLAVEISKK